jgi:hypothetical protein
VLGVIRCYIQETDEFLKVSTTYNCEILKGRELADIIEKADPQYKVINDRIDSFSKGGNVEKESNGIWLTAVLCLYLLVVNMILPMLPFTK